jgi:hypothetical protein
VPDPQYPAVLLRHGHHDLARVEQLNPLNARTFVSLFPPERDTRLAAGGLSLLQTNLICVSAARDGQ